MAVTVLGLCPDLCQMNKSHKITNSATFNHSSLLSLHFVPFSKYAVLIKKTSTTTYLVAPIFVKHNQEDGHDNDNTDHDGCVENRIQGSLSHCLCLFCEGSVDATKTKKSTEMTLNAQMFLVCQANIKQNCSNLLIQSCKSTSIFY